MDDPLRVLQIRRIMISPCLNPYCNGWSSKSQDPEDDSIHGYSLNPYCNGWSSKRWRSFCKRLAVYRLNPYCNGWSSKSPGYGGLMTVINIVLILIVMDDPLRGHSDLVAEIDWKVLILIVMDDPLRERRLWTD